MRRVLVTGSRNYYGWLKIREALEQFDPETSVLVHGACPHGADALAVSAAKHLGWEHIEPHPANWMKHGLAGGVIRNAEMVATLDPQRDYALVFWNGKSKGTKDCLDRLRRAHIPLKVYYALAGET